MNEAINSLSDPIDGQPDRMVDLLIQRATSGLEETEQRELEQLVLASNSQQEFDRFEATAAAFDLSISSVDYEVMPADVHDRLLISAGKLLSRPLGSASLNSSPVHDSIDSEISKVELSDRSKSARIVHWREFVAIAVAAASLLLMLSGLNPFSRSGAAVASATERMNQFLASQPADLVDVDWKPIQTPSASGKVLWSDEKQEGYMVFEGLEPNNPSVEQYQLWIFDKDPAQATPTNGGVFNISAADVGSDGKAIIPIKASVPVDHAVQFAVTVERPGGVYVSKRERLPVLATLKEVE